MAAPRPCPPLTSSRGSSAKAGVVGDLKVNLLQKISLAWTQYRAFQTALAELKGYSDRELSDLGITRHDIVRIAYEEAERRAEALVPSRPVHAATIAAAQA